MKKTFLFFLGISCVLAAADQMVKQAIRNVPHGSIVVRVSPLFEITHCTNTGAAFSLLSGYNALLVVGSVLLLCAIAYVVFCRVRLSFAGRIAFAVLLGGGAGNFIDRIVFGGVTDYIRLLSIRFPVFNLADIAITVSAIVLMILSFADKLEIKTGEE